MNYTCQIVDDWPKVPFTKQTTKEGDQKLKTNTKFHVAGFAILLALVAILGSPKNVFGLGDQLPDQDAFATARGNAFTATADNPSAVFYNPAGISQLGPGMHISVGAYGIVYSDRYDGATGGLNSKTQLQIVPQVFSATSLPYGFTFGLGTYSPYGLRMEWPDNSLLAKAGQEGEIDFVTLNPVLAYRVCTNLSIAAGPTFSYSEADFKLNPGFIDHFRGRDTDAGYDLGILWHPWVQHSFGLTYRAGGDMNYHGHATLPPGPNNVQASANFHFPQQIVAGYSYRPTTNWNFEGDADWSDWTSFRSVQVNPLPETFAFDWHPSWMFNFGGTRYFGNGNSWRASGGFMYLMDTVPDNTFNPLIADNDRYVFSLGIGKSYNRFSWDVSYQLSWGPSRTVSNDGTYPFVDGSYKWLSDAISINFGYRF